MKWQLLITAATRGTIVPDRTFNRMTVMGCPSLFLNIFSHRSSWNGAEWVFTLQKDCIVSELISNSSNGEGDTDLDENIQSILREIPGHFKRHR